MFQVTKESFKESPYKKWQCPECKRYFSSEHERDAHRVSVDTSVQLVCGQCGDMVSDMEQHIHGHVDNVRCGECGSWCGDINSHMVEEHGGYTSVITFQTNTCAGDGMNMVTR